MAGPVVRVDQLWKKFHRGELFDSLRDAVPGMVRWMMGKSTRREELGSGDFWALQDVSFELQRGEALGVIGPNGAGKSTLLKILCGILRANRGEVAVNGRIRALIEVGAGFHEDLTGAENIYLNGAILGMSARQVRKKFDDIVGFAELAAFIGTPIKRYSSGMRARLGFAVAAHLDPEILLVDEVLSVGDAAFRAKCIDHMEQLIRASDVSVIFISHNLEQVNRLCDRCLVLNKGCVDFAGVTHLACHRYLELTTPAFSGILEHPLSRMEGYTVTDAAGHSITPRSELEPGTRLQLRTIVSTTKPTGEYTATLYLRELMGEQIVGDYQRPLEGSPGERLEVQWDITLNLTRGDYALELQIFHRPTETRANIQELIRFRVDEDWTYRGPVWLDPAYSCLPARDEQLSSPSST